MRNVLLFSALGYIAYKVWIKTRINYNIIGVKLSPALIVFDILNPTNDSLTFNSFIGDILYNGQRIAILNYFNKDTVPGNNHKSINIPIMGDVFGFASIIQNIIQQGAKSIVIDIQGTMNLNGINVPVFSQYKII